MKDLIVNSLEDNVLKLPEEPGDKSYRAKHIIDMTIQSIGYTNTSSMNSLQSSSTDSLKSIEVTGEKPRERENKDLNISVNKLDSSEKKD